MNEDNLHWLPASFYRCGRFSIFTLLYGLLRVINIGSIGVVTICGFAIIAWMPSPDWT